MREYLFSVFDLFSLLCRARIPEHKEMTDYIGMSETEIWKIHPNAIPYKGKENMIYLEIRLKNATLTCVLNELRICIQSVLFDDRDDSETVLNKKLTSLEMNN